ncbi:hypothetical protein RBI14_17060 [Alcaligenaceae bacterium B3P038]|nr:hypothetical protein [Alcaligenaceae bacterium B3P038]
MQYFQRFFGFTLLGFAIVTALVATWAWSGRTGTVGCGSEKREFLQRSITEQLLRRKPQPSSFSVKSDGIYNEHDKIWMVQVEVAGQNQIALVDCRGSVEFSLGTLKRSIFERING